MSPSQFHSNASDKDIQSHGYGAPPLKINKASHTIKKSSSSPSSSSSSSSLAIVLPKPSPLPPTRNPVIIYTHLPKVIRADPHDFMALVQKLTGISSPDDDTNPPTKPESGDASSPPLLEINKRSRVEANNDDNESSSVTTEENESCNNLGDGQVNSCFISQPNPCNLMNNIPVFTSNAADILCPNLPFNNYKDSFLFAGASMRTHVPSTSSPLLMEGMNEFHEY